MENEHWEKVSRLFETAHNLKKSERRSFLEKACTGDNNLLKEILSLLDSDSQIHPLLQASVLSNADDETQYIGMQLGAYRIERLIASGGMGQVFLASRQDGMFQKQVAIKIIHMGLQSDNFLKRFQQERQILARLNHPNIANLLDGGFTADGLPYLVMEYVDGSPLHVFIDRYQPNLDRRLSLFLQICEAVNYAHRHLVVHRDLKPGNIFVDTDERIRLLDFGIAKVFDDELTDSSQTLIPEGMIPYTPQYASPEQIKNEHITTVSDVYSLGVILYEMISGQLPYMIRNSKIRNLQSVVLNEIPAKPSIRVPGNDRRNKVPYSARQLKGDLDNICLKALKKEPSLRYESIEQLKNDIIRYRSGLPVSAINDSWRYRTSKFIKRHRLIVGISVLFIIILTSLTYVYTVQLKEKSLHAQKEKRKSDQVAGFLTKLFDAAGPQSVKGKEATIVDILKSGAEKIEKDLMEQPEIQAQMFGIIGDVYRRIGLYNKAIDFENKALEKTITLYGMQSEQAARRFYMLGVLFEELNDAKKASRFFNEAKNLAQFIKIKPKIFKADIITGEADLSYQLGQFTKSDSLYRTAYRLYVEGEDSESVNVANTLNGLASTARRLGRYEDSEKLYLKTLAMRKKILGEDHADVAHTLNHLARLLSTVHRFKEAEIYARQGLAIRLAIYGENHAEVVASMANLANILRSLGELKKSEKYYRKVLPVLKGLFGEKHPYIVGILGSLGGTLYKEGKTDEAEKAFRKSILIARDIFPEGHVSRTNALMGLGNLLLDKNKNKEALILLTRAYNLRLKTFGRNHLQTADAANLLARGLILIKDYKQAQILLEQNKELYKEKSNPEGMAFTMKLVNQIPTPNR